MAVDTGNMADDTGNMDTTCAPIPGICTLYKSTEECITHSNSCASVLTVIAIEIGSGISSNTPSVGIATK